MVVIPCGQRVKAAKSSEGPMPLTRRAPILLPKYLLFNVFPVRLPLADLHKSVHREIYYP